MNSLPNATTNNSMIHNRMMQVNYYLRKFPEVFTDQERKEYSRIWSFRYFAYFTLGGYFYWVILSKAVQKNTNIKAIFSKSRQKFLFPRMVCLNLGLATLLVVGSKEI